jgi:hypothetical protein
MGTDTIGEVEGGRNLFVPEFTEIGKSLNRIGLPIFQRAYETPTQTYHPSYSQTQPVHEQDQSTHELKLTHDQLICLLSRG